MNDEKIKHCSQGLPGEFHRCLLNAEQNGLIICDYISSVRTETDCSDNYRKNLIKTLSRFSVFHKNKSFKTMTREDIIAFLDSFRKADNEDSMHQWIGTYNLFLAYLVRFFKWVFYPNETDRPKPPIVRNIGRLNRREISIYSPSDLWEDTDDDLFLKYCESKRLKCYHMVSRDTSARPHELVKLKIHDIQFRINADGTHYAEVPVNGKTGSRHLPLINCIPYVKDYLTNSHPQPTNQNAPRSLGKHIAPTQILYDYKKYQKKFFPKLLNNPNVPTEDKQHIGELLKKHWNPYIRRHTALTEKSLNAKINPILEQHAGWVTGSNMRKKYTHYFANQSNKSVLEAYGILSSEKSKELTLKVKQCPECSEPNKPDAKFCVKCRMTLKYDGYLETIEKEKQKENQIKTLESKVSELSNAYSTFASMADPKQIVDAIYQHKFKSVQSLDSNIVPGTVGIDLRLKDKEGKEIQRNHLMFVPAPKN